MCWYYQGEAERENMFTKYYLGNAHWISALELMLAYYLLKSGLGFLYNIQLPQVFTPPPPPIFPFDYKSAHELMLAYLLRSVIEFLYNRKLTQISLPYLHLSLPHPCYISALAFEVTPQTSSNHTQRRRGTRVLPPPRKPQAKQGQQVVLQYY